MKTIDRGAIAALALLAACAKPYDPYLIPREELRAKIHTIALAPIRIAPELPEPAATREKLEALARTVLEAGGFAVVGSSAYGERWRAFADAMGGIWDPVTGEIDKQRFELVEQHAYRELVDRHRVDALLYLSVYAVDLFLQSNRATFCGTSGPVYWPGALGSAAKPTLVIASCLGGELYDMSEKKLYSIQSGFEVIETYFEQTRAVRPVSERLQDDRLLQQAVDGVLGGLVERKNRASQAWSARERAAARARAPRLEPSRREKDQHHRETQRELRGRA